tara:strand:+ start:182 stop:403 length:222 start_codon:yes stop_codon:yes gene_type:complete
MTHYKTIEHAKRAVEQSSVSEWKWGAADKVRVLGKLAIWLFMQDIRLTHDAIEKFVTEELGQDSEKYNVLKGN